MSLLSAATIPTGADGRHLGCSSHSVYCCSVFALRAPPPVPSELHRVEEGALDDCHLQAVCEAGTPCFVVGLRALALAWRARSTQRRRFSRRVSSAGL